MSINEQFAAAQIAVKNLSEKPGNLDLLALYANFKQATDGDADGNRPNMTDFIARAKYDAWAALAGTAPEVAQEKYIELVNRLTGQDSEF
ncbi:MAG: acyl-CoA-binding protein [Burkholderiaceae bacterium]|nr:acyl-CoA-binding protein [Burkholderiaceae bacterium]